MQLLSVGADTTDPYLVRVIQSRQIYEATGMVVPPWKVDSMPSDWMQAITALAYDYPKARIAYRKLVNDKHN